MTVDHQEAIRQSIRTIVDQNVSLRAENERLRAVAEQMATALTFDEAAHDDACHEYYCCYEFCDFMRAALSKEEEALAAWQAYQSDAQSDSALRTSAVPRSEHSDDSRTVES